MDRRHAQKHVGGMPVISSSLRNRRWRGIELPPEPPPAFDLIVTGTLTPDATGNYIQITDYNGYPAFARENGNYFIWYGWFKGIPYMRITDTLGVHTTPFWRVAYTLSTPPATYYPMSGATGNALVSTP